MPIYSNFYQTLTTACPIVELRGYAAACGLKGHLYAYLDFYGPTGTARDGLAEGMLALAIEKKQLAPGLCCKVFLLYGWSIPEPLPLVKGILEFFLKYLPKIRCFCQKAS